MKITSSIARILLGLVFFVFGLNGFLHFLNMPPPPGLAGQYMGALFLSHYLVAVFLLEVAGGFLLLVNLFVPVGLVFLGPVMVNILLFHCLLAPAGLPLALVAAVLWLVVFWGAREAFAGIFVAKLNP